MKVVALLVVLSLSLSSLAKQADCRLDPSQNAVSMLDSQVSDLISGLVSPYKQTNAYKSIRSLWNSDSAKPIRDKFEEYKERAFERFARTFNKQYNQTELPKRLQVFLDRYNQIETWHSQYKAGEVSFDMNINDMADMTEEELQHYDKLVVPDNYGSDLSTSGGLSGNKLGDHYGGKLSLPTSKSWKHFFGPVRDQEDCGSCYAFATVDTVAAYKAIKDHDWYPKNEFSVQQVVDCSTRTSGCNGGWPSEALGYIKSAGGLADEEDYPYRAERGYCYVCSHCGTPRLQKFNGPEYKTLRGEAEVQRHVAEKGPVIAYLRTTTKFYFYSRGVFDDPSCGRQKINHAIIIVGYGRQDAKDYWLIRNSYGDDWGDDGYMKILRGKQLCRIAEVGLGITKI